MDTYDKLKILEDVESQPGFDESKVKIEMIGKTSCKFLYPCGCYSVHHFVTKTDECQTERSRINKSFFVELCEEHKKTPINIEKFKTTRHAKYCSLSH